MPHASCRDSLPENGVVQLRMGEVHEGALWWMRVRALDADGARATRPPCPRRPESRPALL